MDRFALIINRIVVGFYLVIKRRLTRRMVGLAAAFAFGATHSVPVVVGIYALRYGRLDFVYHIV